MFIVFEGIDGSGKGTQISRLAERMEQEGRTVCSTAEPSKSDIGLLLRKVLTGKIQADARVAAQLFTADRLDHILNEENGIKSLTESGVDVICDRYYFSSYAYQSLKLSMEKIMSLNEEAEQLAKPDLTIYLDLSAEKAMERINNRGETELFEQQQTLHKVRENYEKAFALKQDTHVIRRVDASLSIDEISEQVWETVRERMRELEEEKQTALLEKAETILSSGESATLRIDKVLSGVRERQNLIMNNVNEAKTNKYQNNVSER